MLVVDVVIGIAVARQHALDTQFGVLPPLPADAPQRIVEHQFDTGARRGFAQGGAVENHVFHFFAAQVFRRRFTQHPAHRIDDIGFAATVGADHPDQLAWYGDGGGVNKTFETG